MATILSKNTTHDGVACTAKIEDYDLLSHGAGPMGTTHVIDYVRSDNSLREHIDFFDGEPADIDIIKS